LGFFCSVKSTLLQGPDGLKIITGSNQLIKSDNFKVRVEGMLNKLTVVLKERVQKNRKKYISSAELDMATTSTTNSLR
jgi:hypothetical protein